MGRIPHPMSRHAAADNRMAVITIMKIKYPRSTALRRGLTLIELLVVLTILIALGGIVVGSVPGMLERTQSATAAANVPEIDSAIRRNLVTANGVVGNRFDSLVSGGSGIAESVGGNSWFQAVSLSESDVEALAEIGLTELVPANPAASDATFDSHQQQPITIGPDTRVCAIAGAVVRETMERIWNLTPAPNSQFLVFGLGSKCTLVGGAESALFPEAPVHFSDDAASSPKNMYCRYLIVIELKRQSDDRSQARYVGVAIPDRRGLRGIREELQEVYSKEN